MNKMDDACMCTHSQDEHLDDEGQCTRALVGGGACSCRRFRSYRETRARRREDRFWLKVGRGQ